MEAEMVETHCFPGLSRSAWPCSWAAEVESVAEARGRVQGLERKVKNPSLFPFPATLLNRETMCTRVRM